ncbi:MAG: FAH family protein, partial [Sphingobium yanoikuyae]
MTVISLVQFKDGDAPDSVRGVAAIDESGAAKRVTGASSTRQLALDAIAAGQGLAAFAEGKLGDAVDLSAVTLLSPIDHEDAAHLLVAGTGLTHLGSAEGRDKMHKAATSGDLTDSMRMFLMGVEGGKPADDGIGAQPEWFYKGDGQILVDPGQDFTMPAFAEDGGEEPEVAGIYLIDADGTPVRLGFAIGNEFSDHITERGNYLWLAHSKLRQASLGPELLLGDLPQDLRGTSRIV